MRKAFDDVRALLGAYPSSTVMGISVLAGSLTGWILEELTGRQAAAAVVSGLVAILVKQVQGSTSGVQGAGTVAAGSVAVSSAPGSSVAAKLP